MKCKYIFTIIVLFLSVSNLGLSQVSLKNHAEIRITHHGLIQSIKTSFNLIETDNKKQILILPQGLNINLDSFQNISNEYFEFINVINTLFGLNINKKSKIKITSSPLIGTLKATENDINFLLSKNFLINLNLENNESLNFNFNKCFSSFKISENDISLLVDQYADDHAQFKLISELSKIALSCNSIEIYDPVYQDTKIQIIAPKLELNPLTKKDKIKFGLNFLFFKSTVNRGGFKIESIESNLNNSQEVITNLNISDIKIPEIKIQVGNQTILVNQNELKKLILNQRTIISELITKKSFAYITKNLVKNLNQLLDKIFVPTSLNLSTLNDNHGISALFDNMKIALAKTSIDIGVSSIESMEDKTINIIPKLQFNLGKQKLNLKPKLHSIHYVDEPNRNSYSMAVTLSEELMNAILQLFYQQAPIKKLILDAIDSPGTYLSKKGIKIHFIKQNNINKLFLVLNLGVYLPDTEGLDAIIGYTWEKTWGGSGVILFPIEFEYNITTNDNKIILSPQGSPIENEKIKNTFNYPLLLPQTSLVKNSFFKKLTKSLQNFNKPLEVNLNEFLSFEKFKIEIKNIGMDYANHLQFYIELTEDKKNL